MKYIFLDNSIERFSLYTKIIKKHMYTSEDYFDIKEYLKYDDIIINEINSFDTKKILFINIMFDGKNGFDIARTIRESGDLESQIIIISDSEFNPELINDTLVLEVIKNDENFITNFYKALLSAHKILMRHSALSFSSYDEIYRIPYENIYMVEKNYKDDSVTIYTKDDSISRYITIKLLGDEILEDPRFFKCGRSCIINLHKVTSYDCVTNTVYFDNGMTTNKIAARRKSLFKEILKNSK